MKIKSTKIQPKLMTEIKLCDLLCLGLYNLLIFLHITPVPYPPSINNKGRISLIFAIQWNVVLLTCIGAIHIYATTDRRLIHLQLLYMHNAIYKCALSLHIEVKCHSNCRFRSYLPSIRSYYILCVHWGAAVPSATLILMMVCHKQQRRYTVGFIINSNRKCLTFNRL